MNINIEKEENNKLLLLGEKIYNTNILLSFQEALDYFYESKNIN